MANYNPRFHSPLMNSPMDPQSQYPYCYLPQGNFPPPNAPYYNNNNNNNPNNHYQRNYVNNNNNNFNQQQSNVPRNSFPNMNNGNYGPNRGNQHFNRNQGYQQHRNGQNRQHNNHGKNNFKPNQNQNGGGKDKGEQATSNEATDNEKFYCEACDRGFKTDEKYQEHLATHATCGVNGCKFTAAAKLVQIHYQNFHLTGIDKKIPSLDTAEDIQKYIEERKRKFPSNANQEKTNKLEVDMEARGITLQNAKFGKLKSKPTTNATKEITPTESADQGEVPQPKKMKKDWPLKGKQNKAAVVARPTNKPTLLQKLLVNEVRHERNILLQCVRYIVKNNFFDE